MAARIQIFRKQRIAKERVHKRRKVDTELLPGDLVLVRRKLHKKNLTKKLLPNFIGPLQVVKKVCLTTYLVEDLPALRKKNSQWWFNAHVCQIRRFHGRSDLEWDYSKDVVSSSSSSSEVNSSESEDEPTEIPQIVTLLPVTRDGRPTRQPVWMRPKEEASLIAGYSSRIVNSPLLRFWNKLSSGAHIRANPGLFGSTSATKITSETPQQKWLPRGLKNYEDAASGNRLQEAETAFELADDRMKRLIKNYETIIPILDVRKDQQKYSILHKKWFIGYVSVGEVGVPKYEIPFRGVNLNMDVG
ncbi:hypothetical protein OUZ56_029575 [Daphnia magna]|uniref:Uncharacterized protein n=1 Tax=Daphnia magna TaxID=35525 RepID=A0ABR0B780_9CRUS|nr:hypothetical protein OUZ56_029575 [Daphnia magna]